jgi:hypothetical protein
MKRFRIQLVIALVVLICGVSLMGIVYLVFNKPEVYINPGVIVTQPSPVSSPVQPLRSSSGILRDYPYSYTMSPMPYATAPKAAMQPSRGLYATSSAQVHEAGGGAGYAIATTSGAQAQRGINYTTTTVTTFATFAMNSRQVAAPEAQYAPEMARLVSEPHRAPGPPTPGELDPDHQLVEHPIGSPLVLVLMAGLYAVIRKRKEDAE